MMIQYDLFKPHQISELWSSETRTDAYFLHSLGNTKTPSSSTLRQRMDDDAEIYRDAIDVAMMNFMETSKVPVTPLETGHAALDLDVFPMDNSKTKKDGVSRTYKGYDAMLLWQPTLEKKAGVWAMFFH